MDAAMRRASLIALSLIASFVATARADEAAPLVAHRTVGVDGLSIFYREAGPPGAPAVLLLHGFPSSSFMYRNLMPPLARRYRVIAPDYPGFGHDVFFTPAGAQAYRRDLPNAQLQLLDAGHFALETHAPQIAAAMLEFLARTPPR
jgi:pimeloyl-ACP methyl ester carboxylesterase